MPQDVVGDHAIFVLCTSPSAIEYIAILLTQSGNATGSSVIGRLVANSYLAPIVVVPVERIAGGSIAPQRIQKK